MKRIVEIVCCSVEDCVIAVECGAGRIELCSAIELSGLTPSIGLESEAATAAGSVPIISILRPRPGGFCYSAAEFLTMTMDARELSYSSGFAFGILNEDRTIDVSRCKQLA